MADRIETLVNQLKAELEHRAEGLGPCDRVTVSKAEMEAIDRLLPVLYVRVGQKFGDMIITLRS